MHNGFILTKVIHGVVLLTFVHLVLKLWKILNVKSATKGKQKRDITHDPVRSSQDWKLEFLREFAVFLQVSIWTFA